MKTKRETCKFRFRVRRREEDDKGCISIIFYEMEQIVFSSNLTFFLFAMLHSMLEKGFSIVYCCLCSIDMTFVLACIYILYWYVYDFIKRNSIKRKWNRI